MAGLFGGQGPTAYINSLYAPQQAQLAQQQQARAQGLQTLVASILAAQQQRQPDVYGAAAQDATSAANAAAQSLARANPDAQTQEMLRAIGAPQSQQDAVGAQNNVVFNGQGALGQYVGGALPAGVFAHDQAARGAYESSLPALVGQTAIRGLGHLDQLASTENANLATQRMADLQKARTDLAGYVQKNQSLKAAAAKTAFDQNLATAKYRTGVDEFNTKTTMQARVDAFNQKYKIAGLQMQGQKLALSARKFAQQTLQSDRSHGLQLKRIGLQTKSLQLRALADEYKLRSGGFTPSQQNRFTTDAGFVASQAKTAAVLPSYDVAMQEMMKRHVPLSIAQKALYSLYPRQGQIALADPNYQVPGGQPYVLPRTVATAEIAAGAKGRGLDPQAVLAVASMEGLGGGVGDNGTSFGPWQLHMGGALPKSVAAKGADYAAKWAWTPAGINYALDQMAKVARGLSGPQAIAAIVRRFERPLNPAEEVAGAASRYAG